MTNRLYFPLAVVIVAALSFWSMLRPYGPPANSTLKLEVAPASAVIKLDGRNIKAGEQKVTAGSHVVSVSLGGFERKTISLIAQANQPSYAAIVLTPNSADTQNWYKTHPSDAAIVNVVGSHQADFEVQQIKQATPFINQLPVTYGDGHGGLVTISPGAAVRKGSPTAIYINAATPSLRQDALAYIRNRGYDPANTDIVFTAFNNPFGRSRD
ncbi:MAG TPA: hypothetical protein VHB51_00865 [Candidatus Saccharimonadales bacterium]|nr:hypothetical protein [Candidatus Saccharimonadales bacterium]